VLAPTIYSHVLTKFTVYLRIKQLGHNYANNANSRGFMTSNWQRKWTHLILRCQNKLDTIEAMDGGRHVKPPYQPQIIKFSVENNMCWLRS